MTTYLSDALKQLEDAALRRGLNRGRWAELAGLRPETLSRLFSRDDCELGTLTSLAGAAGRHLLFVEQPDRQMPGSWDRDTERRFAMLCASASTDVRRWLREGPRYFLAGLAMMMASARGNDRASYVGLAHALSPAIQDQAEFDTWLAMTPVRPSRFLPMVRSLQALEATAKD